MRLMFINQILLPLLLSPLLVYAGDICDNAINAANLGQAERQVLVDQHNELRKAIAGGTATGGIPAGKNIYELKYDCKMEVALQAELDKCTGKATMAEQYGQNIAVFTTALAVAGKDNHIKLAIESWSNPIKYYGLKNVENYDDDRLYTFANMAHGKTLRYGCAYKTCNAETHISCIYNLVGGYIGGAVYEKGKKCTKNTECTTYTPSSCIKADGLCKYSGPVPIPGGGTSTMCASKEMSDKARNRAVEIHNTYRSQLARGMVRNGKNPANKNLPTASFMPKMVYDCAAEDSASAYASTCSLVKSAESDRSGYGENVYIFPAPNADRSKAIEKATESWWNQIFADGINWGLKYTKGLRDKAIDQKGFIQMAWAKSIKLGCAMSTCGLQSFVVCRYSPAGNILNEIIYPSGKICSGCVAACDKANGLCSLL